MVRKPYKDGIELSCLGMGNMRLPVQRLGTKIDRKKAQEIIDYAIANGINCYDTAYVYHLGESEKFLGDALKKYPRDSYYLATKYFRMVDKNYQRVFEKQLKRLKTDHVDFYLVHSVTDGNWKGYKDSGCIEYFMEQRRKDASVISAFPRMRALRFWHSLRTWPTGILHRFSSTILTGSTTIRDGNIKYWKTGTFRSLLWSRFAAGNLPH